MTNASCADCGRIVAFRTHDPSEIAECRNCGTWVKRSAEMPGVAVSVKQGGPVARKTAIPPRKDESKSITPNPNANTTRSATKRAPEKSSPREGSELSPAAVYAAIRELQKSIHDLRVGQKTIQAQQEAHQRDQNEAHKALHNGQKSLHSGQKQLFGQVQELRQGQEVLLERTLQIADMPVSRDQAGVTSTSVPVGPLSSPFEVSDPPEELFYTTPFSSLKIPLIPLRLEDLDVDTQFKEEGTFPTIPVEDRSDREGLINNPLPEPPPYVEPEASSPDVSSPEFGESASPESEGASSENSFEDSSFQGSSFEEGSFDDSVFEKPEATAFAATPETGASTPPPLSEDDSFFTTPENDSSFTAPKHDSPFTIEGPPDDPFTIAGAEGEQSAEPTEIPSQEGAFSGETSHAGPANEETSQEEGADNPFAITPKPFGAQEFTHSPVELEDPFATELDEPGESDSPFGQTPEAAPLPEGKSKKKGDKSLSQKIAAAKEEHQGQILDPKKRDLYTEKEPSRILPLLLIVAVLAAIGAGLYFFTDLFGGKDTGAAPTPPLIELPQRGTPLPTDDPRIAEAETVATQFLQAESREDVAKTILPVDPSLLVDFWEPITAPTIERFFQGSILNSERVEIDFLVNDIKGKERLLSLVKNGSEPFLVNWKKFAECEDATLFGIAQGPLILDSGEELDEAAIRSFVQEGKELTANLDLGNFQGFKLHNFTEEVVALGVVRKDSPEFEILTNAIAATQLNYKGQPSIRAILRVSRIEEGDLKAKKPARLEIIEVISIEGKTPADFDEIIQERLPEVPAEASPEETEAPQEQPAAPEEAPQEEAPEVEAEEPAGDALPPVPADTDPLVDKPGETPLFEITYE